jgi:hypothetical protein
MSVPRKAVEKNAKTEILAFVHAQAPSDQQSNCRRDDHWRR